MTTDLHALYATLWERVPETRPLGIVIDEDGGLLARGVVISFFCNCDRNLCTEQVAAALCRVAVEDFIASSRWVLCVNAPKRPGDEWEVSLNPWDENDSDDYLGPTIHHALVAAALAVAEVKL